ncbi:MAG TPA: hypothetical protein VL463_18940 [Kofleriaceae bacterium]|nr:hypothetical protein [Kofleriaceae bacterium]
MLVSLALGAAFTVGCSKGGNMNDTPDAPVSPADANTLPKCSNGLDDDGDGKIDFPNDPGCLNGNQDDEMDDCPSGPNCPQCGNGVDDDGDSKTDYPADPDCAGAWDTTERGVNTNACGASVPIYPLPNTLVVDGMIQVGSSNMISNCGGLGPETAYQVDVTKPIVMVASTDNSATGIDTVIYLRAADCTTELTCNDNASMATTASTLTAQLSPGTYYLIVDAAKSTDEGAWEMSIVEYPGQGEACDAQNPCAPGYYCRMAPGDTKNTCQPPHCRDGYDDDSDTRTDFPNDPGCGSPDDDDETDDCPNGVDCPACANGKDDDGDQLVDYGTGSNNDPGCLSAAQPVEGCGTETDVMTLMTTGTVNGDTTGFTDNWSATCGGSGYTDALYVAQLPQLDSLSISETVNGSQDVVLDLFDKNCGSQLACAYGYNGSPANITRTNVSPGLYAIVADNDYSTGPFTITLSGVISPGGRCDVPLFTSGALACANGSACDGSICKGNKQCDDGVENDTDGKIDYPNDPGCSDPTDDSESDDCPNGPNCPACSNNKDDDLDGKTDYPADSSCTAASGTNESCNSLDGVTPLTSASVTGDTTGKSNDFEPSCVYYPGQPDLVYQVDVPALDNFAAKITTNGWYSDLALYDASCGGTNLTCSYSSLSQGALAAGRYFLVVDGDYIGDYGSFTLNVSGTIAKNQSCEGALAQSGALTCGAGYSCKGNPGSRKCSPAACNDGADNDNDQKKDYPNDPGCSSTSDDDETDDCPNGPNCPVCSNNKDDDGDNKTDYPADTSCKSAAGTSESCASIDSVIVATTPNTVGAIDATLHDDFDLSCASTGGLDQVYQVDLPKLSSITFDASVQNFYDSIEILDSSCGGTALACNDFPSTSTLSNLAAGRYFVVINGYYSDSVGTYLLQISGKIASGGACDVPLAVNGALTCDAGLTCKGSPKTCQP